ncbi:citrulline utilization hydrolase CtlX [Pollutibacter soli]|uniref:citrulline utilization hydrolase CtlX n=1 Tax=Pollutibacter soli TaxID=3034157 RepID=UPI003013AD04
MQTTSHLLMIRPVNFGYNPETAVNNSFQVAGHDANAQDLAVKEFDMLVEKLRSHGMDVNVIDDTPEPYTPDSIFPNNWISFHTKGTICLYPMFATNRRKERKQGVIDSIKSRFQVTDTIDLTGYEEDNLFLEGTGSMVLDRDNKIAYACLSPRTDLKVLNDFGEQMDFDIIPFISVDALGKEIYHTNVMMCVADKYVVICLDSIRDEKQKTEVTESINRSGKKIIAISYKQMESFAGNMLQVENAEGKKFLVMSSQAYYSLNPEQVKELEHFNPIIHSPLENIETNGGGSARCMIAEVFLDVKR